MKIYNFNNLWKFKKLERNFGKQYNGTFKQT